MTPQDLGCSREMDEVRVGSLTFKVTSEAIDRDGAIVSRGTTVWKVNHVDEAVESTPLVLKEAWRYDERGVEGELLSHATDQNIRGVARYCAHENDDESVHKLLGEGILKGAKPWAMRSKKRRHESIQGPSKRSRTFSQNTSSIPSRNTSNRASSNTSYRTSSKTSYRASRNTSNKTPTSGAADPNAKPSGPVPSPLVPGSGPKPAPITPPKKIPNRIRTLTVLERGIPLTEWRKHGELALLRCFRDAIRGHFSLLKDAKILHRDISINNIMIACQSEIDYHYGFLIDLDLAIRLSGDNVAACGAPERTGTYEFLSINALLRTDDKKFHHCYYDDLESFFWVLLYVCHGDPRRSETIQSWSQPEKTPAFSKLVLATSSEMFSFLLDEMDERCKGGLWESLFTSFRRSLFTFPSLRENNVDPVSPRVREEVMKEEVMKKIYSEIIEGFEQAIGEIQNIQENTA